jgi:hypothetical protein
MTTPFQQVKSVTKNYIKYYQDDVNVHDKKLLNRYSGNFLYAIRESGSNILKETSVKSMDAEDFKNAIIFLIGSNQRFFVFHSGHLREVSINEFKEKLLI